MWWNWHLPVTKSIYIWSQHLQNSWIWLNSYLLLSIGSCMNKFFLPLMSFESAFEEHTVFFKSCLTTVRLGHQCCYDLSNGKNQNSYRLHIILLINLNISFNKYLPNSSLHWHSFKTWSFSNELNYIWLHV